MSFLRGGPPARPTLSASPIGHQYRSPDQTLRRPSLPVRLAAPEGPCLSPSLSVPRSALPAGPSHRSSQTGPAARSFLPAHCFGHAGRVYCQPDHSVLGGPVCRHRRSIPITRYCLTIPPMPALLIGPPDRPSLSVPRRSLPHWPCLPVLHNGPACHSSVAARLLGPPCRPPRSVTNIGPPIRPFVGPPCRSALPPLRGPACRPPYRCPDRHFLPDLLIGLPKPARPLGPSCRPIASAMPVVFIASPIMPSLAVLSADTSAAFPSPGIVLPDLPCLPYLLDLPIGSPYRSPDEASRTAPVCQSYITAQDVIPPWRPACSAHPVGLPDRSPISVPRSDPSSALPAGPPCRP